MRIAVADASPLIILARSGFLDCLNDLFSVVKVPLSVLDEIHAGSPADSVWFQASSRSWIESVQFQVPPTLEACQRLGRGETEVIEFARLHPGTVALLDDRAARRVAQDLEIPVTGTLGVVAASLSRDKASSFDGAVTRLREAGLYINPDLVEAVRKSLGQ